MLKTLDVTGHSIHRFNYSTTGGCSRRETLTRKGPVRPLEELLANAAVGTTRSGVKQMEVGNWTTVDRVLEVRRWKYP